MIRYLSFEELLSETFCAEDIECHKQIWKDGSRWTGYAEKPRHYDGLLFLCSHVEATCTLPSGKSFAVKEGDVLYIPRGCRYELSFRNGGSDPDLYTVNFILTDRDGNELRLSRGIEIYTAASSPLCRSVAAELSDAHLFSGTELKKQALLFRLFDALSPFFEKHSESYYPIRRGVTLLLREWDKNEKIKRYAEASGVSESNFYLYFKAWANKSPVDYRNEIRINAARSMLTNSDLSISEIAARTGFDDPYYFSRVFKKLTGVSPRAFRNGAV